MNYIAIRPGIRHDGLFAHMEKGCGSIESGEHGTLIVYETNLTPLESRDDFPGKQLDLHEETLVQDALGSIGPDNFRMVRAGEGETGSRGRWVEHNFRDHEEVVAIEKSYTEEIGRPSAA